MISNFFRISVITALGAGFSQAEFLGEEGEIAAKDPVYATGNAPDSVSSLLGILNARGAQGFQFRQLATLNSANPTLRTTLFINERSDSDTYSYESHPADSLPANFLANINERGAAGFEYLVNFNSSSGNESVNLFEKRTGSSETFNYRLPLSPTTLSDFLALLETQGAEGYEWLGIRALRPSADEFVQHQLFVKRSSDTGTYTYRSGDSTFDGDTSISQYNSLGSAGFRWIFGTTIPGVFTTHNIYVKSSARPSTFSYNFLGGAGSRSEFVTASDQQGSLGRYFKTTGTYIRNGVAGAASVYVDETPILPRSGSIDIASNGQVTFVPDASGNFQLQTSSSLQTWTDSGAVRAGTAGTALIFNTGIPVSESRNFFRVVSP